MCAKASAASPGIKQRCKYTTLIAIQKSAMKGSVIRSESHATSAVSLFKSREKQSTRRKSEFRSCVQVQVAVLGSPSLIIPMVSVDVKLSWTGTKEKAKCSHPHWNSHKTNSHETLTLATVQWWFANTHTPALWHITFFFKLIFYSLMYTHTTNINMWKSKCTHPH